MHTKYFRRKTKIIFKTIWTLVINESEKNCFFTGPYERALIAAAPIHEPQNAAIHKNIRDLVDCGSWFAAARGLGQPQLAGGVYFSLPQCNNRSAFYPFPFLTWNQNLMLLFSRHGGLCLSGRLMTEAIFSTKPLSDNARIALLGGILEILSWISLLLNFLFFLHKEHRC